MFGWSKPAQRELAWWVLPAAVRQVIWGEDDPRAPGCSACLGSQHWWIRSTCRAGDLKYSAIKELWEHCIKTLIFKGTIGSCLPKLSKNQALTKAAGLTGTERAVNTLVLDHKNSWTDLVLRCKRLCILQSSVQSIVHKYITLCIYYMVPFLLRVFIKAFLWYCRGD